MKRAVAGEDEALDAPQCVLIRGWTMRQDTPHLQSYALRFFNLIGIGGCPPPVFRATAGCGYANR